MAKILFMEQPFLDQGLSYQQLAEVLFLNPNTPRQYFKAFQDVGVDGLILLKYQVCPAQLPESQQEQLQAHLRKHIYLSAFQVRSYIQKSFFITYPTRGVGNLLHRLGFAYKKPKLIPGKADARRQRAFLQEYDKLKKEPKEDEEILFMDAAHSQDNSKAAYSWIEKGKVKEFQSNTGRQGISINEALTLDTYEMIARQDASINAQSTIKRLKKIEQNDDKTFKITVICDNAKDYKSKLVQEYLTTSRINLKSLPPHSPDLNLAESFWSFFHKKVTYQQCYENFSAFKKAVNAFFDSIPSFSKQLKRLLV